MSASSPASIGTATAPTHELWVGGRKRLFALALIMAAAVIGATVIAMTVLYRAAFAQERLRLIETAQSQARLMEAVARFDALHSTTDVPGGAFAATLSQIRDAHQKFQGSGESGEIILVRRREAEIEFLLNHRHDDLANPPPIPSAHPGAEAFRRALAGESGSLIGPNPAGREVLAAYEPVSELNLGIVAEIEMAEIRAPFVHAAGFAALGALVLVGFGSVGFRRIANPIIADREQIEKKYRTLFESASDGVFVMASDRVECNAAARAILGLGADAEVNADPLEMAPAYQPDGVPSGPAATAYLQAAQRGTPQRFAWTLQQANGQQIETVIDLRSITLGDTTAVLGTISDMSAQKRAQLALQRSEETLRLTLEATQDAVWDWDLQTEQLHASPTTWTLRGHTPHSFDWTIARWLDTHHPDDRPKHEACIERLTCGEIDAYEIEIRTSNRDGDFQWSFVRARCVERDDQGLATRIVASEQDITDRRNMADQRAGLEARLRHLRTLESLGTMAGGIAHDFNNLLQGILGNAEIARFELAEDHPALICLDEITCAGLRAAKLAGQMRDYAGCAAPVLAPLDLRALVAETVETARGAYPQAQFCVEIPDRVANVLGDGPRLREILNALIANGAEASRGPSVELAVSVDEVDVTRSQLERSYIDDELPAGHYVRIAVRDDGRGMTAATLSRVFDPFFTTKFAGRGLGMASVLGLVRAHHGAIYVDSVPGQGTCVTLLLPPEQGIRRATPIATPIPLAGPGAGTGVAPTHTIMVVDDEPVLRELARHQLERLNYHVIEASNGAEALTLLEQASEPISLILLDYAMPVMRGDQAVARLRALVPGIKIVMATGYSSQEVGLPQGERYDGFLHKPYHIDQLAQTLAQLLGPSAGDSTTSKLA